MPVGASDQGIPLWLGGGRVQLPGPLGKNCGKVHIQELVRSRELTCRGAGNSILAYQGGVQHASAF